MTIFTWAWADGAQTNGVKRASLPTPADIKPTGIHPASYFCKSRSKVYRCRFKLKILGIHQVAIFMPIINFTSKHLVLKRIPRIFKL